MLRRFFWTVVFVCWCTNQHAQAGNILAVIPLNSPSHFIMFDKLLRTLAERGHTLDVVSHFPQKKPIRGYTDLSIADIAPPLKNNLSVSVVENRSHLQLMRFMLDDCGFRPCQQAFGTSTLRRLRASRNKYDLLITELFGTDCALGFAHALRIPAVASLTTSVDLPWGGAHTVGNPAHPAYVPSYFTVATPAMTLLQRVENVLNLAAWKYAYNYYSAVPTRKLCNEFFGPEVPDVNALLKRTSLVMVNSHFSINQARPTVPNFIEVGGLHIEKPKPVPKHLEKVIKENKHGFVYLTMGSMVMTESLSPEKLQGMFDAFAQFPHTVLWKANKTRFPDGLRFPDNIHFEPWMPQLDLLCHPDIKLFVTHGGLLGTQEAIYCGVPRIGIPLFADQELNIFQSINMGIAIKVDYNNITKESMLEATREILGNKRYQENVKRVSELFKDRQNHPLDTAIYWVEYVMKHKGAPHLRTVGADLPWYQYYLIDVALVIVSSIVVILYLAYIVLKPVLHSIFANSKSKIKSH